MEKHPAKHEALLLLGPTGSGKTPLGGLLERHGLKGRRCLHFDFGACLRRIAAAAVPPSGLDHAAVGEIRAVLAAGALFEAAHRPLVMAVVASFLSQAGPAARDLLVLNGLPRHSGQTAWVEEFACVRLVFELACAPETALDRLRLNAGGDRTGRNDDSPALAAGKLADYRARTRPLLDHYRGQGVPVLAMPVEAGTSAAAALAWLQARGCALA